ncbi:hypothetical protein [Rhizocola hellebori]|nr:hypothetical protein [Rhizocola hellebori]
MTDPLIEEASKKAAIAWIAVDGGLDYAVWCLPLETGLVVVTGPGEQDLPGLENATTVKVSLRGDHGGAIVHYPAIVERVRPENELWEVITPQLASKRLNASGTSEDLIARWGRECAVYSINPAGEPSAPSAESGAAEPRPSTAANATRKPFKLHRVRSNRT